MARSEASKTCWCGQVLTLKEKPSSNAPAHATVLWLAHPLANHKSLQSRRPPARGPSGITLRISNRGALMLDSLDEDPVMPVSKSPRSIRTHSAYSLRSVRLAIIEPMTECGRHVLDSSIEHYSPCPYHKFQPCLDI